MTNPAIPPSPAHLERQFEAEIEAHLLAHAWIKGDPTSYDRDLGLDMDQLIAFIKETQSEAWDKLVKIYGTEAKARLKFGKRVGSELTSRGVIAVLRSEIKDLGVNIKLAYFAPAHDLTPELGLKYAANRLVVTRQAPVSESNPQDTIDLLLSLNGIPVSTAELKTQTTGQSVDNAMRQYRYDRNPNDLIFRSRTLVQFAVDQDMVYMTTRLAGKDTEFLPFNQGTGGPGADGGAGNPVNPVRHRTTYLWEQVWARDAWLDLFGSFVHVEQVRDADGKKTGQTVTVFPRFHQWHAVTALHDAARSDGPGRNNKIQH
jgi:type I restriction enzyme R subunit